MNSSEIRTPRVGLLTFNLKSKVRSMRTLPSSLQDLYTRRYEIFYIDEETRTLAQLRKEYNLDGFISFPRNTSEVQKYIKPVDAQRNNVVFKDSNEFSSFCTLGLSHSNGYFYARDHNMNWWWSFLSTPDAFNILEPFRIGFYCRAEHDQHDFYDEIFKLVNAYSIIQDNFQMVLCGQDSERKFFKASFYSQYPGAKLEFIEETDQYKFLNLINKGTYLAAKLKDDCIPNLYFEAKINNIGTRVISDCDSLTGIDEIEYLTDRKQYRKDLSTLRVNYHLIVDPVFRKGLYELQKEHVKNYPEPNKESFNAAMDETLSYIKEYNGKYRVQ